MVYRKRRSERSFVADSKTSEKTSSAARICNNATQPIQVVVRILNKIAHFLNKGVCLLPWDEKTPIGGKKCYKIFDTSNTLCTRTSGATKKIYCDL
jgi:hypothetical protein